MSKVRTKERVAELAARGLSGAQIARELSISPSTVAYHLSSLETPVDERCNRRYDWSAVQAFYDQGNSVTQCLDHFGMARKTFYAAVQRGAVVTPPAGRPLDEVLARSRNRSHLKRRLLREGLLRPQCELCGIAEWRGAPLSLQLHHVNGDGHDNRLENLQLLCPNCHSQTETWGGRNKGRRPDAASPPAPN